MPTEPVPSEADRLLDEACGWLSKKHSGHFSAAEQQQLAAWLIADPAHEQAWQKAQAVWQRMEGLRGRDIPGSKPLLQERYRKPARQPIRSNPSAQPEPTHYRRRTGLYAVACSALLAVILTTLYPPELWRADYATEKGEQRTIVLADGSQIMLNSATALAVHFDDSVRRVDLIQGEAFFEVAKHKQQPFIVTADGNEVRAVGTAFDVQRRPNQIKVELVEGIVEIQDSRHQHRQRLKAGQTALIEANTIAVQSTSQIGNMALWRDGYLQFDGLPLREAIAQINQYRPGRVVLLNTRLADKRVSGLFRLDSLDQAIASLKNAVPELQTVSITPYLVVLR